MYHRGFTLIELMVAISIIAILSGIIVASLSTSRTNSLDAKRISDIKNIQLALAQYYNDYGKYPDSSQTGITQARNIVKELTPNYISKMPVDPKTNAYYFFQSYTTSSGGNCSSFPPVKYHLGAALEGNKMPDDNIDYNAAPSGFYVCGTLGVGTDFAGQSPDCVNASATGDKCYDVINN